MPKIVLMSVPQMWEGPANHALARAAKNAGIEFMSLVWEPHSAAAHFSSGMRHGPRCLNAGDVLLMADVGGGTRDFGLLKIVSTTRDGGKVRFETEGVPTGMMQRLSTLAFQADQTRRNFVWLAAGQRELPALHEEACPRSPGRIRPVLR